MTQAHVVIGASGAIGLALTAALASRYPDDTVYAVSREAPTTPVTGDNVCCVTLNTADDDAIRGWLKTLKADGIRFGRAICTVGMLHGDADGVALQPEKKLEDLSAETLLAYFSVNTVVPALWLKNLVGMMSGAGNSVTCLSARVGSISDNRLGGWYGYRASKAALNMMMKTAAVEYARRSNGTSLVSYHPGTVDSGLSRPFQANVPEGKLFTPEFTAEQLLNFLDNVTPAHSPYFTDWQHKPIDW